MNFNILKKFATKKALKTTALVTLGAYAFHRYQGRTFSSYFENLPMEYDHKVYSEKQPIPADKIPSRVDCLSKLKSGGEFDVLVIGGGCTGSGVALDAVTRGLKVALIEKDDFASGTSSRSTKLIHGGVRYLEKAFKTFDFGQMKLVMDALAERRHLLSISPNLSYEIPLVVPLYYRYPEFFFYAPYFWVGMKMYDLLAGSRGGLGPSHYMGRKEVIEKFPMLNQKGLKGAIVYYDGMHNDARMNLAIALTAATKGAAVTNHVELKQIVKNEKGKIIGAYLRDNVTGNDFKVRCKAIINATGCFVDRVRNLDSFSAEKEPIIQPSSGVHVVLPGNFSPKKHGMLIPNTDDGRVLFMLPWENSTLAGTTDSNCDIKDRPRPKEKEVAFIIKELRKYFGSDINIKDVKASWSGIRPLARDVSKSNTASLSRDHVIELRPSGLITISGGKWTTYRKMSQDTVDRLLKENVELLKKSGPCVTKNVPLVGASGWSLGLSKELESKGFPKDIADHLSHNYGYLAYDIADLANSKNLTNRLTDGHPFIEAEVLFGIKTEHAMKLNDIISRRTRLAFLDSEKTREVLPKVLSIMADEKCWDQQKRAEEYLDATSFVDTMNVVSEKRHFWNKDFSSSDKIKRIEMAFGKSPLSKEVVEGIQKSFEKCETLDRNGTISSNEVEGFLKRLGEDENTLKKHIPRASYILKQKEKSRLSNGELIEILGAVMLINESG